MTHLTLFDRSLGELARSIAGAIAVFHEHDVDFCCAGSQSLRNALGHDPLAMNLVAARLAALEAAPVPQATDWRHASPRDTVNHIVHQYHEGHRRQVPILVGLARKVEATHAHHPLCPQGLAALLSDMSDTLEAHMQEEEDILFPLLCEGADPLSLPAIAALKDEHRSQGAVLDRVMAAAHHLKMPEGACNSWRALLEGLALFKQDLMQHIHLENNILFEGLSQASTPSQCASRLCGCAAR